MKLKLWPKKKTKLDEHIEQLTEVMDEKAKTGRWSDYAEDLELLADISTVNNHLKGKIERDERNRTELIKTSMVIAAGITEILIMMNFEKIDSFTTKAMSRLIKPKI